MAEWLKALVLKTRDGNIRRFESCPFRQKSPILAFFLARSSIRRTSQEENTNLGDFKLVGHVLSAKNRQ